MKPLPILHGASHTAKFMLTTTAHLLLWTELPTKREAAVLEEGEDSRTGGRAFSAKVSAADIRGAA